MRKFKVVDADNLYGEREGTLIAETSKTVILDLNGEDVVFYKHEVKET